MADSLSQKSSKSGDKSKHCLTLTRTTSETIRLSEPEKNINHPTSLISTSAASRKKAPSFQIVSVTTSGRTSNDGGEDSADDLDESHTEEMSDVHDRITDLENETPSYSEDTFSREELFYNTSGLATAAPVIPTSSQYGLAIVAEGSGTSLNNVGANIAGDLVSVADLSVKHSEERDQQHPCRNERFKVVKIESTEPFKRGRWTCMDYLDHTMIQTAADKEEDLAVYGDGIPPDNMPIGSVYAVADFTRLDHPHAQSQTSFPALHHHQQLIMVNLAPGQSLPAHLQPQQQQQQQQQAASTQYYNPPPSQQPSSTPATLTSQSAADNGPVQPPAPSQIPAPSSSASVSAQTQTAPVNSAPPQNGNPQQPSGQSAPVVSQQQPSSVGVQQPNSTSNAQQSNSSIQQGAVPQQPAPSHGPQPLNQQQSSANLQHATQPVNSSVQVQQQQQQFIPQQQPQFSQPPATSLPATNFVSQPVVANSAPTGQQTGYISPPQSVAQPPAQPIVPPSSQPQQAMSQPAGFISAAIVQQQVPSQTPVAHHQPAQSYAQLPVFSQPQPTIPQQQQQAMSQPAGFMTGQTIPQQQQQLQQGATFVPSSQPQNINFIPNSIPGQQSQAPAQQPLQTSQTNPAMMNQPPLAQQPTNPPPPSLTSNQGTLISNPQPPQTNQVNANQLVNHIPTNTPVPQSSVAAPGQSFSAPQQQQPQQTSPPNSQQLQMSQLVQQQQQQAPLVNHQQAQSYSHPPHQSASSQPSSQNPLGQSFPPTSQPGRTLPAPLVMTNGPPMAVAPSSHLATSLPGSLEAPAEPRIATEHPNTLLESLTEVTAAVASAAGADSEPAASGEDPESSSGTNAVAIDNKIEQAMDLVKSHLMFAVREEVEVLKEKIVELTGRINQLEYENTVLKANASVETLQQLVVPPNPAIAAPLQQAPVPAAAPQSTAPSAGGGGGKTQQAPVTIS